MSLCACSEDNLDVWCKENNLYSSETGDGLTMWMFYVHQKVNIALPSIEIAE